MDDNVRHALANDRVVDITTTGRGSGSERRIEIWIHEAGGRYFITGRPGRRSWYANLLANPRLTVHLKRSVTADLAAHARPITTAAEKRAALQSMPALQEFVTGETIEDWVAGSPLVEIEFD